MSYLRDTVIVLKHEPFREHDAWLTLYGRKHGKLTAVARGARRFGAKHLGHLEAMSEVEVMIAKGAAFDKLAVARLVRPRPELRSQLANLAIGGAVCHLVDELTRPAVVDEAIFDLLRETLELSDDMVQEPSADRARLLLAGATLKLLDRLGYGPTFAEDDEDIVLRSLLLFMRRSSLRDLLRVTAPPSIFCAASSVIENALEQTPLQVEPHGPKTIYRLLDKKLLKALASD